MKIQNIILIAASTGGAKILRKILDGMPVLNGCIVIVLHMIKEANILSENILGRLTDMEVKIAYNGEQLKTGAVYIAPSGVHLILLNNQTIELVNGPKVNFVCPSADVTMKSVRYRPGTNIIGIILTGMGKDGAEGIGHIKSIGGTTYAQNQETCAVWGMPKVAINMGYVDNVLSPEEIRKELIALFSA